MGSAICGRGMYDAAGAWGGTNPFDGTLFVLTHRTHDAPDPSTGFVFVDGLAPARWSGRPPRRRTARTSASAAGADLIRQCPHRRVRRRAGHLDCPGGARWRQAAVRRLRARRGPPRCIGRLDPVDVRRPRQVSRSSATRDAPPWPTALAGGGWYGIDSGAVVLPGCAEHHATSEGPSASTLSCSRIAAAAPDRHSRAATSRSSERIAGPVWSASSTWSCSTRAGSWPPTGRGAARMTDEERRPRLTSMVGRPRRTSRTPVASVVLLAILGHVGPVHAATVVPPTHDR